MAKLTRSLALVLVLFATLSAGGCDDWGGCDDDDGIGVLDGGD